MICTALITVHRQGAAVRLLCVADTKRTAPRWVKLDQVQILTTDALPFALADISDAEGRAIENALAIDVARQIAEVEALPPRIRRIAEATGLSAPYARALALEAS